MVLEAIGEILMDFVLALLDALPDVDLDIPSFGPMVGLMRTLDQFLPMHEVIDYVGTVIGVIVVLLGVKVIVYLYGLIPLKGT